MNTCVLWMSVFSIALSASDIFAQIDSFEEYKRELRGKGSSLVDDVRRKNGIPATSTFVSAITDKLIGGSFEDSPADFLIARDFSIVHEALRQERFGSEKPIVIVIYRRGYSNANPKLLEHLIRNLASDSQFSFKHSIEDFPQIASLYVVSSSKMQIFDVRSDAGGFGLHSREQGNLTSQR